jgi:hypothetical protein
MRQRDRRESDDDIARTVYAPDDSGSEHDGDALRSAGEAFLAAADEVINRALSGNSEQFLAQNRQMGGQ